MALLHVDFFSDVLGMSMNMDVLLPQQTQGQIGMEGRAAQGKYKTMYLLHGMSDDQTIWQRRTSIERYVSSLGIAVVMPTTHLGFYTDTTYGMRYWTFLSQELPKICREFFPQMSAEREDTLAAGLSMGGYGAWKLGLGAGGTFGAAASCPAPWIWWTILNGTWKPLWRSRTGSPSSGGYSARPRRWRARTTICLRWRRGLRPAGRSCPGSTPGAGRRTSCTRGT